MSELLPDEPARGALEPSRVAREVDFRRLASVVHNDFGLRGAGRMIVAADRVTVEGHRISGFSRKRVTVEIAVERIRDATSYGRLIWFFADPAPGESGPAKRMAVYARSEPDAQALFDALPRRMSPERAQAHAEQDAFLDKLERRTPRVLVVPALVAINVLVFLALLAAGAGLVAPDAAVHIRFGSNYGPLTAAGEWWRLVTNTFLHFGIFHIALNMWALWDAGRLAERMFGPARLLALYLFAGVVGSLASLWWNPSVNSAGASGAVFGVLTSVLVYALDPRNGVPLSVMREYRFSVLVFLGYSLAFGFMHANIDNAAHLGGVAGGAIAALAWPRPLDRPDSARSRVRFGATFAAMAVALVLIAGPLLARADARNEEGRMRALMPRFLPVEQGLDALAQETLILLQRRRLSPQEAAARFTTLAGEWQALQKQVNEMRIPPSSRYSDLRTQLVRMTALRGDGLARLGEGITAEDGDKVRSALAVIAESNKAEANVRRELAALGAPP